MAGLRAVQDRDAGRRLRARPAAAGGAGSRVASVVAHPGYSIRGRTPTVPGVNEPSRGERFADALQSAWAQGKHRGAEIPLYALTAPEVEGGQFWGPEYLTRGRAHPAASDAGVDRPGDRRRGCGRSPSRPRADRSEWADERAPPRGRLVLAADEAAARAHRRGGRHRGRPDRARDGALRVPLRRHHRHRPRRRDGPGAPPQPEARRERFTCAQPPLRVSLAAAAYRRGKVSRAQHRVAERPHPIGGRQREAQPCPGTPRSSTCSTGSTTQTSTTSTCWWTCSASLASAPVVDRRRGARAHRRARRRPRRHREALARRHGVERTGPAARRARGARRSALTGRGARRGRARHDLPLRRADRARRAVGARAARARARAGGSRRRRRRGRSSHRRRRRSELGDRVVWSVAVSCGECDRCTRGLPQQCRSLAKYGHERVHRGWELSGGFATHVQLRAGTDIVHVGEDVPSRVLGARLVRDGDRGRGPRCGIRPGRPRRRPRARDGRGPDRAHRRGDGRRGGRRGDRLRSGCLAARVRARVRRRAGRPDGAVDVARAPRHALAAFEGRGLPEVLVAVETSGAPSAVRTAIGSLGVGGVGVLVGSVAPGSEVCLDPESLVRRLVDDHRRARLHGRAAAARGRVPRAVVAAGAVRRARGRDASARRARRRARRGGDGPLRAGRRRAGASPRVTRRAPRHVGA